MKLDLKAALKRRGVSQTSVAKAVGISNGFMSGLCSGTRSPSQEILLRIAAHLDMKPNDLYDLESEAGLSLTPPLSYITEIRAVSLTAHHVVAATTLYPKLGSAAGYRSRMALPRFHITEGDLLIVDEKGEPGPGDFVVVAGSSPRLTRNVGADGIRLIDHDWNEVIPSDSDTSCRPMVALLRARPFQSK